MTSECLCHYCCL